MANKQNLVAAPSSN